MSSIERKNNITNKLGDNEKYKKSTMLIFKITVTKVTMKSITNK